MEPIIRKLMENRGIRVDEANLNEAWPPSLNSLTNFGKDLVRKALLRKGVDIQNSPVEEIKLSSGRDPRLKSDDVIVFKAGNAIDVWVGGRFVLDNFKGMSWKSILDIAEETTLLKFDHESAAALRQKQTDRKEAQSGRVVRHKAGEPKYPGSRYNWKKGDLDKSGYVLDPGKYKRMFAEMQIKNGEEILKRAKDVYIKAAAAIATIDFENDVYGENYENLVRNLPSQFRYLKNYLAKYTDLKNKKSEDAAEWYKPQVMEALRSILDTMKKLQKYIK